MERYTLISRQEGWTYAAGCPAAVSQLSLWWDSTTLTKTAQLQLRQLGPGTVTACTVELHCFGEDGTPLQGRDHSFTGLAVPQGGAFGEEAALALPSSAAATVTAAIRSLTFADGTEWVWDGAPWEPLPKPQTVEELFPEPELAREYRLAVGEPCVRAPRMHEGLFLCACGCTNLGTEEPCRVCGRSFPELATAMELSALKTAARERRRREEEEKRRREEERRARRKETRRYLLIALITAVILGVLAWVIPTFVIPRIQNERAYDQATALMEQGSFDEAHAAFLALGDFSDSPEMSLEAIYRKGMDRRSGGQYEEAVEIFRSLGDYADSAQQAELALEEWKEEDYQAARALVEAGAYPAAAAAFQALGDYRDSAQWIVECQMLQREGDYTQALAAMERGEYTAARKLFLALGSYRESVELAEQCRLLQQEQDYQRGCELLAEGDFDGAIRLLQPLGDYADASEKLTEAHYGKGMRALKEEDFATAVDELSLCQGYQQTDWNLKQAKMGYAKAHPDRKDKRTLAYLTELKAAYFQGAKTLYDQIFGWKAEIVAFSNSNQPYPQETVSKFGTIYVHFKITGGEPGQTLDVRTVMTVPGGAQGTVYHNGCSDGYEGYTSFWFDYPSQAPTGNLTFQIYDGTGKLLCSGSVRVVS